jgi:hypothetical protein
MSPGITQIVSALLLMLATLPALAEQADSLMFSPVSFKLAQLSPNELRALRERWEAASPEDRIRLRQYYQDRLRQLPKPAQDALSLPFPGMPLHDSGRESDPNRRKPAADGGFGFGFERRQQEDSQPAH